MKNIKSKILHASLKTILTLILIMPIFGSLGFFPEPTRDLYNTDKAFNFINILTNDAAYISYLISFIFIITLFLLWTKREALAALLVAPITINIIGFHLFLDGGLLTSGAILGNVLLLLNIYFLWKNRDQYNNLLDKRS